MAKKSTVEEQPKSKRIAWRESLTAVIARHSNFFVVVASVLIFVTGVAIANGKADWWLSSVAILGFFLLVFALINARVLIKSTLAFLVSVFIANFALQAGTMLSPYSTIGVIWLSAQLFLFFFCMAVSYLSVGYRSRWSGIIYAQLGSFTTGLILVELMLPNLGVAIATALGVGLFLAYYKGVFKFAYKAKLMPPSHSSEKMDHAVEVTMELEGWEARKMTTFTWRRKEEVSDYLVWNDEYAFLLHPVELENKFSISPGRKTTKLVHRGQSINPWLLYLINRRIPVWKTKNAPIMLVLLDISNKNGPVAEAIGVSIPDTKKKIPVGIYPAKQFYNTQKKGKFLFKDLVKNYSQYLDKTTEKQRNAMADIGVHESSVYLEPKEEGQESSELEQEKSQLS